MDTGTPRWRTGAGIVAWILIAVATAALAWAAVDVVAGYGAEPASVAVPNDASVDPSRPSNGSGRIPSSDEPPTDDATAATDDSTTDGAAIAQPPDLIHSSGGTVWVACTASGTIQRKSVTPANGWQHEVDDDGSGGSDDEVEVTFVRGDDEEIRIRARCRDGEVDAEVSD